MFDSQPDAPETGLGLAALQRAISLLGVKEASIIVDSCFLSDEDGDLSPSAILRAEARPGIALVYSGCSKETDSGSVFTSAMLDVVEAQKFPLSSGSWFAPVAERVRGTASGQQRPILIRVP